MNVYSVVVKAEFVYSVLQCSIYICYTIRCVYCGSEVNPVFINGKIRLYWYIILVFTLRKMVEGVDGGAPLTGCGM